MITDVKDSYSPLLMEEDEGMEAPEEIGDAEETKEEDDDETEETGEETEKDTDLEDDEEE